MKLLVIGAGAAGICSTHQIKKNFPNSEVICIEINNDIGGTWMYQEKTGTDEFGVPIMSSMYKNLKTNLPKQVMQFSDFLISDKYETFMKHNEYLAYLNEYVNAFDIKKHIKFQHMVTSVKRVNDTWQGSYKNLKTGSFVTENFDYVFVCNGHYSHYEIPEFKGKELFKGVQTHSHNYRSPESFKNKKVLVIGAGASGLDISIEIANVAEKLIVSHHLQKPLQSPFPNNYIQKPDVREFTENSVIFVDGTQEQIDEVLYCTGYLYHCPFLDPNCGIKVQSFGITPLYRHVVNIENPSMFFIGVPQLGCAIPMIDCQIRYVMANLRGDFKFPEKDAMLNHMNNYITAKDTDKNKNRIIHYLGKRELSYYCDMSEESGIVPVPPVYCAMRVSLVEDRKNLYTYRSNEFKIIDSKHYMKRKKGENWNDKVYDVVMCNDLDT